MTQKFKLGDEVKLVNDNLIGKVLKIDNHKITILNEFGFEEIYNENEIIINKKLNDFELENQFIQSKIEPLVPLKNKFNQPKSNLLEIDLHIGHLTDNLSKLSNHQMLQIQLKKIKETIALAKEEKIKTVIFIHGKGKGILKDELYKILEKENKISYFDASFQKYKLGATEVRFF